MTAPAENIEGFTVAGKAYSSAKPNSGRDRSRGLGRFGAHGRRDRQVPRCQETHPRRIRRAQAQEHRRRRARTAGRPEGDDAKPLYLGRRCPTRARRPRSSSPGSSSSRRPTSARWMKTRCCSLVGKLLDVAQDSGGQGRPAEQLEPLLLQPLSEHSTGPGSLRARRLRQAARRSLRKGDRRRPGARRAAGPA